MTSLKTLKPFIWVGLTWAFVGALLAYFCSGLAAVVWMLGLWILTAGNLVVLANAISSIIAWAVNDKPELRPALFTRMALWAVIKLVCLILFGIVLFNRSDAPRAGLLLGIGTLLVVPVIGGLWWSQKELKHA